MLLIACSSVLYLAHDPSFGILEIATIAAPDQLAPLAGQGLRAARKLVVSPLLCDLFSRVDVVCLQWLWGCTRPLHGTPRYFSLNRGEKIRHVVLFWTSCVLL